jgi:tRNA threonylcarbamoyl adenosine modification protein YeaZ
MLGEAFVLGIDATEAVAHAAVSQGEEIVASACAEETRNAEALLALISDALRLSGCAACELNEVVVALGPGSFTGIRTGLATAQGFSLALGIKLCGISVLLARLSNSLIPGEGLTRAEEGLVLYSHKAAYGEERYAAGFSFVPDGKGEAFLLKGGAFFVALAHPSFAASEQEVSALASGSLVNVDCPGPLFEGDDSVSPAGLLLLARRRFSVVGADQGLAGHYLQGAKDLRPMYVKRPQAKTLAERGIEVR